MLPKPLSLSKKSAMKKISIASTLLMCLLLLINFNASAQWSYGKVEEIEDLKNRKLIVVTEVENEKVVEKLKKLHKEAALPAYKAALDEYNANLKVAIETFWPYETEIVYKTWEQAKALQKAKSEEYGVIYAFNRETNVVFNVSDSDPGLDWNYYDLKEGDIKSQKADWSSSTYIRIDLIENIKNTKKLPIIEIGLPHVFPQKSDLTFGLQYCAWYMENRLKDAKAKDMRDMAEENAKLLKEMTVVIRESDLDKDLTKNDIKALYKFPFELVSDAQYDSIILAKTVGKPYLIISPQFTSVNGTYTVLYSYLVMDPSNGEVMDIIYPGGGGAAVTAMMGVKTKIGMELTEYVFKTLQKDVIDD